MIEQNIIFYNDEKSKKATNYILLKLTCFVMIMFDIVNNHKWLTFSNDSHV